MNPSLIFGVFGIGVIAGLRLFTAPRLFGGRHILGGSILVSRAYHFLGNLLQSASFLFSLWGN